MIGRGIVVAIVLAVTAAGVPTPVRADDVADDERAAARAKKLYNEGDKLFNLGKFSAALEKFEKAYEAKPIPGLLFNIGQCHRNLDDYDAAIFSFRKYLKLLPDASNRAAVLEYIDELEREKQKKSSADLSLIEPDTDPDVDRPIDGRKKPIYKKWWFWGGIAVVGATIGTALVLSSGGGPPSTGLGNVDFEK